MLTQNMKHLKSQHRTEQEVFKLPSDTQGRNLDLNIRGKS